MQVTDHVMCGDKELDFGGICVVKNFVNEEEERRIVAAIDSLPWAESQSGRKKQVPTSILVFNSDIMTTPIGLWTEGKLQEAESASGQFHWTSIVQQASG